jgi:ABC-type nickel/cobalt efflux system permease component RcnA
LSYSLVVAVGIVLFVKTVLDIKKSFSKPSEMGKPAKSAEQRGVLPIAIAVGMVPCPGVVIIMLFALSFNLLAIGLVLSFVMAFGMASTISMAGLLSIISQEALLRGLSRKERIQYLAQMGLTILGSLFIIGFGGILLAGIL